MNSNNKQVREIEEDVPQYRSVMISGPISAPPIPRSFASVRPSKAPLQTSNFKQDKQTLPSATWKVSDLPSLPAAYFLEKSNVYVDGEAQDVANRICDCLRKESVAAICDNEDKNLLIAETCDCVKLAVRMFSDNGKIVVEVQRKCGCSYRFRETARTVLRSAKGVASEGARRVMAIPSSIPLDTPVQQQQRAESALEVAMQQLCSDRLDSQLIGMESLEQITQSASRFCVSNMVLEGECLSKVLAAAQEDTCNASSEFEEQHISVMKRRAMTVVANALSALAEAGKLDSLLSVCGELKSESFICSLVDTLREASTSPHDATQAARCIRHLLTSKEVEAVLIEMSAISVVSDACVSGACRSALLEQESKKLKLLLSNV